MDKQKEHALLELTAQIVAAHVSNNAVSVPEVPSLIQQVHRTLANLSNPTSALEPLVERPQPAVSIKKSVTDAFLICLEDGKKLKMLKRHLKTAYDMSPEQYRERWGLPSDYPMVAPDYALRRSELAKQNGLGNTPSKGRKKRIAA